jgi:regulator of protease activity HflC (stomatin/prohibitin superfamily)
MRINLIIIVLVFTALSVFVYYDGRYILNDHDQVVITQFGKVVGKAKTVPGEYFKVPIIQKAHYFSKKYQLTEWNQQIPTKDKQFLNLNTRAIWQIYDPIKFYQNLNSIRLADDAILESIGAVERNFIISHTLSELIGEHFDDSQVVNIECARLIERGFIESSKPSITTNGIALNNVEAKVASLMKREP